MSERRPSRRPACKRSAPTSKSWDRTVLLAGAQLVAAGAILIGGTVAVRIVNAPAKRAPELAAVTDRTALVATSAAERFVLDRSTKGTAAAAPAVSLFQIDTDLLPPLVRADFADPTPALSPAVEAATPVPVEAAEVPVVQTETMDMDEATPPPNQPIVEAVVQVAAITTTAEAHLDVPPPLLPPPIASSIALAPSAIANEAPSKPKSKSQLHEAGAKKRRPADANREPAPHRRVVEARYVPDRQLVYARPVRLEVAYRGHPGACSGGPARWIGTRIYWGSRC